MGGSEEEPRVVQGGFRSKQCMLNAIPLSWPEPILDSMPANDTEESEESQWV